MAGDDFEYYHSNKTALDQPVPTPPWQRKADKERLEFQTQKTQVTSSSSESDSTASTNDEDGLRLTSSSQVTEARRNAFAAMGQLASKSRSRSPPQFRTGSSSPIKVEVVVPVKSPSIAASAASRKQSASNEQDAARDLLQSPSKKAKFYHVAGEHEATPSPSKQVTSQFEDLKASTPAQRTDGQQAGFIVRSKDDFSGSPSRQHVRSSSLTSVPSDGDEHHDSRDEGDNTLNNIGHSHGLPQRALYNQDAILTTETGQQLHVSSRRAKPEKRSSRNQSPRGQLPNVGTKPKSSMDKHSNVDKGTAAVQQLGQADIEIFKRFAFQQQPARQAAQKAKAKQSYIDPSSEDEPSQDERRAAVPRKARRKLEKRQKKADNRRASAISISTSTEEFGNQTNASTEDASEDVSPPIDVTTATRPSGRKKSQTTATSASQSWRSNAKRKTQKVSDTGTNTKENGKVTAIDASVKSKEDSELSATNEDIQESETTKMPTKPAAAKSRQTNARKRVQTVPGMVDTDADNVDIAGRKRSVAMKQNKSYRESSDSGRSLSPEEVVPKPVQPAKKKRPLADTSLDNPSSTMKEKGADKASLNGKAGKSMPSSASMPSLPRASSSASFVFSSCQPPALPSSQTQPRAFDVYDLDESIFVALPAIPKDSEQAYNTADHQPGQPCFWWPARIISRNRQNFRVGLVIDNPKKEILKHFSSDIVVPTECLDEHHLKRFIDEMTEVVSISSYASAIQSVSVYANKDDYEIPSEKAFSSSVKRLKSSADDDSDAMPEVGGATFLHSSPNKKQKIAESRKSSQNRPKAAATEDAELEEGDSNIRRMIKSLNGGGVSFDDDSESEDLDADIEAGTLCLALARNQWWPAKVVAVHDKSAQPSKKPQKSNKKQGPYEVEMYPPDRHTSRLSRDHILLTDDYDFATCSLGAMAESIRNSRLEQEIIDDVMPEMRLALKHAYQPSAERHRLFFGSVNERNQLLPDLINYGAFEASQIQQLQDYIVGWVQQQYANDSPDMSAEFKTLDVHQRNDYVVNVLAPTALEMMLINDDKSIAQQAEDALKLEDPAVTTPSDDAIRMKAHEYAARDLRSNNLWYTKVLTARQLAETAHHLSRRPGKPAADDDSAFGRKRSRVNYAE